MAEAPLARAATLRTVDSRPYLRTQHAPAPRSTQQRYAPGAASRLSAEPDPRRPRKTAASQSVSPLPHEFLPASPARNHGAVAKKTQLHKPPLSRATAFDSSSGPFQGHHSGPLQWHYNWDKHLLQQYVGVAVNTDIPQVEKWVLISN
jgi:hypothetical protein